MVSPIVHPSEYIDKGISKILRERAAEAERLSTLHPDQLDLLYAQRWFKMFVPADYGGLAWSLPQVLRVEEGLSWADGSTGWVVTLCAGAGWFAGFLSPALAAKLFADKKACIAGSGAASGVAEITPEGFEVTGKWKYASGALHATAFTANCVIQKNGITQTNADGSSVVRAFVFRREEVVMQRTWNSMGMIATGSHSFEVNSLPVSGDRCFVIDPPASLPKDPVYQFPFLQLAESTLAINLSGMAMRFLDLCEPLFLNRAKRSGGSPNQVDDLNVRLARAQAEMHQRRVDVYTSVDACWTQCCRGEEISGELLKKVSNASHHLAQKSLRLVDELYPYCGLAAANAENEMNRVWRNLHTASQHSLFQW